MNPKATDKERSQGSNPRKAKHELWKGQKSGHSATTMEKLRKKKQWNLVFHIIRTVRLRENPVVHKHI